MNYLREPMRSHKNKPVLEGLFLLLAAFLVLLFASRSSFLYPFNDWNDANSYFSVGKALFNGKMPYRDVFDQKGMYLYFLYGLAYLVSHTTFLGVFADPAALCKKGNGIVSRPVPSCGGFQLG